jgi:hypothetical protein
MTKLEDFIASEYATGSRLRDALVSAHNRKELSRPELKASELQRSQRRFLYALNPWSRIIWGRAWFSQVPPILRNTVPSPTTDGRLYFVTFINREHETAENEWDVPLREVRAYVRRRLNGTSFIGMIEPAYFVNVCKIPFRPARMVCWHTHCLVWNTTDAEMEFTAQIANVLDQSSFGLPACDVRRVSKRRIGERLAYLLKAPCLGYSIHPHGARPQLYKRLLRPGEHLKLYRIMRDLLLDKMAVAGGEGAELLRAIRDEALSEHRRRKNRRPSGTGGWVLAGGPVPR